MQTQNPPPRGKSEDAQRCKVTQVAGERHAYHRSGEVASA